VNLTGPMNTTNPSTSLLLRNTLFSVFCAVGIGVFWAPLYQLIILSLDDSLYSHVILIPLFSIAIIYLKRKDVFLQVKYAPAVGAAVVLTGLMLFLAGQVHQLGLENYDYLSLCTSGFVLWLIGGFVGFFGRTAIRKAMFPLLFLFFAVPIPANVLEYSTIFLQQMSAGAVDAIFRMIGLPYMRYGTVFELPEVTIKVAEQCSGIRSSLALLVATTAAGYVFLETGWRRLIAVLAIIPITIFKNALRITALTLMASYVDPSWLTDSWLHRAGGKPFFFIALLLWSPILWLLWRSEKKHQTRHKAKGSRHKERGDGSRIERAS